MKVVRSRYRLGHSSGATIYALLITVGIPRNRIYTKPHIKKGKFWDRPYRYLLSLLEDARNAYRRAIQQLHPDKKGDVRKAASLNVAWKRIKAMFKRHNLVLE